MNYMQTVRLYGQLPRDRKISVPISIFFLSTFFQRLGVWLFDFPFPIVIFLSPFILLFGWWKDRVELSPRRSRLFVFFAASVIISFFWGIHSKATAALLYLLIYAQWNFYSPAPQDEYRRYLNRVAFYVSAICILGTLQFFSQFIIKLDYIFSWSGLIPNDFLIEHNVLNEISYGSGQYKSNGVFLLEASTLSMLAARVLLLEVELLKTTTYIIPLLFGLTFSLSGSGLVFSLLFTIAPLAILLAGRRSISTTQILVGIAAVVALGAVFLFYQDYFLARLFEFSDPQSSAHARYTSTLTVFNEYVTRNLSTFLLGYGPGSFVTLTENSFVEQHATGWIKLFVELGLLGTLSFCGFFTVCVYSSTKSWYITVAMLFQYLMLDSPILTPQSAFLAFSLYVFPVCNQKGILKI